MYSANLINIAKNSHVYQTFEKSLSVLKRAIDLEELIVVDERVKLLIVLCSLFVLNDILIEDAIGSVKIHHRLLIQLGAEHQCSC